MLRSLRLGSQSLKSLRIASSPAYHQSTIAKSFITSICTSSIPSRSFTLAAIRSQEAAVAEEDQSPPTGNSAPQEFTKFAELAEHKLIHPTVIDTIVNSMDIHTMTDVQRLTLNHCLDGSDVIGQARTGTGKTLAFLMPIVQNILKDPSTAPTRGNRDLDVRALIISPTRELAEQIAVEARKICSGTSIKVSCAVGGTQKQRHLRDMQSRGCHILVGTPGRVKDILTDRDTGVHLDNIQTFVLDEADRLLDIGFAPDIEEIQDCMPDRRERPRQTLMFSATVPKSVVGLVRQTLMPDFKFIRTVDPDEAPTHARIPQKLVTIRGMQNQLPTILEIAQKASEAHHNDPTNNLPFKAIVYYGSVAEVGLAYTIVNNMRTPGDGWGHPLAPMKIFQMSSRLEQAERTRQSEGFRRSEEAILFSSDVTARGMDFPNVSHVIQVGPPKNPDDYVHRIGRTGRAGKPGEGWLIINEDEHRELSSRFRNTGINLQVEKLPTSELDMTKPGQVPASTAKILQLVESGVKATPYGMKKDVYKALFGVLPQQHPSRDKQDQLDLMNDLAKYGWGLSTPPGVPRALIQKLGFARCDGINFDDDDFAGRGSRGPQRGFGGDRGGRSGGYNPRDPFGQGSEGGLGVFSSGGGRDGGFGRGRDRDGGFGGRRRDQDDGFGDRDGGFGGRGRDRDGGFGGRGRDRDNGSGRDRDGGRGGSLW